MAMIKLSEVVRERMGSLGISGARLCEAAKVSTAVVNDLRNREKPYSRITSGMDRVFDVLGIDPLALGNGGPYPVDQSQCTQG
jgi:hypothetical protein